MALDKSQHRIRRMFGAISSRYDLMNRLMTFGLDIYWRRRTVHSVPLEDNASVLDVCCGTGDLALGWSRKLRGRGIIVGTDFTHPMLVLAVAKAARRCTAIQFLEADTLRLPFTDDAFSVVSTGFGIRNVGETERGLAEMTRVCRPEGNVVILECSTPRLPLVRGVFRLYFGCVVPLIGRLISPDADSAYAYLPASAAEFPQGEAMAELMRGAGLIDVQVRSLSLGSVTLYVGRKPGA